MSPTPSARSCRGSSFPRVSRAASPRASARTTGRRARRRRAARSAAVIRTPVQSSPTRRSAPMCPSASARAGCAAAAARSDRPAFASSRRPHRDRRPVARPTTRSRSPPSRATGRAWASSRPASDDVRGLEYAHDSATLYGVVPTVGDDRIVTIDPATGRITATVGTLANGADEIVSLAYDPGDTSAPGDDRLLVLEVGTLAGELRSISPASPSTSTLLGSLSFAPSSAALFTGLAYDSIHDQLFAASPFGPNGLYVIDLTSCPPSPCDAIAVEGSETEGGSFPGRCEPRLLAGRRACSTWSGPATRASGPSSTWSTR